MKTFRKNAVALLMVLGVIGLISMSSCENSKSVPNPAILVTIDVKTPGTLAQEITKKGIDTLKVEGLSLSGSLNGADLLCLRHMAGGGLTKDETTKGQLGSISLSNISFQKDTKNVYYDDGVNKHTIDEDANVLPEYVFSRCPHLKSFAITDKSILKIGGYALSYCPLLSDIKLAEGVTVIDMYAFRNLPQLSTINFPASAVKLGFGMLANCTALKSVTLSDNATSLSVGAFSGCTALTSVNIPSKLESILDEAFKDCTSLSKIQLPVTLNSIGFSAFINCTSLQTIVIPEGVKSILDKTFLNCTSLTSITLSKTVKSVGISAFAGCSKLASLTIELTDLSSAKFDDAMFGENDFSKDCILYVPANLVDQYKALSPFNKVFGNDRIKPIQ